MILFSGHGDIANYFSSKHNCKAISLRHKSITELETILTQYDIIIHNAANLAPKNLQQAVEDNFLLTKNILDVLCRVNPGAKFIYLSSMSILNNQQVYLQPSQMTAYAFSKYLGEIYTLASPLKNTVSVRFSTIFYQNPSKDGLSDLVYKAVQQKKVTIINEGVAKRDFLPLEILTNYLYKLCVAGTTRQIYNVCSGVATSFAQIVAIIKLHLPNLMVENNNIDNTTGVIHDFSAEELLELGIVNFDLSDYVNQYIDKLTES
jgi:nucleoside-diphosphate-sugar epimerase